MPQPPARPPASPSNPPDIPPWTVKGVPQDARDLMMAAARRSQQTLGQWLIETARRRVDAERVTRVQAAPPEPPALGELAALLGHVSAVPGAGRVAARVRRLMAQQLDLYLLHGPAAPPDAMSGGTRPSAPPVPLNAAHSIVRPSAPAARTAVGGPARRPALAAPTPENPSHDRC